MMDLINRIENGCSAFVELTLDSGSSIVLNSAGCPAAGERILKQYQVPRDRCVVGTWKTER